MEADAGEFLQDWELLHHNLDGSDSLLVNSAESKESTRTDDSDDGVEGMIQTNYFSLDSQKGYTRTLSGPDVSEAGSEASDNPSWIDPGLETRYPRKLSAESWSDSGSDRSDDRKFNEFEGKTGMGSIQDEKLQVGFEGVKETGPENEKNSGGCWSDSGGIGPVEMKVGDFEGISEMGMRATEDLRGGSEVLDKEKRENEASEGENEGQSVGVDSRDVDETTKKKSLVWWKVPMEFFRYCVLRVSPGWALSVAAAVIGFVILGRKLYKMKKKSRALELKVIMDDKKVSQFMSRAARLNEAFSVVKRVPVIRPSLPGVGMAPWPVVSMR